MLPDLEIYEASASSLPPQEVMLRAPGVRKSAAREEAAAELELELPSAESSRIYELARGLDFDFVSCFKFVRDTIEYAPYFGILRGAERTLLDREGNDADQALLLVALLRASGYEATIAYETMTFEEGTFTSGFMLPLRNQNGDSPYNAASWLNIPEEGATTSELFSRVGTILANARRDVGYYTVDGVPYIVTDHFWGCVVVDGASRAFCGFGKMEGISDARRFLGSVTRLTLLF